MGNRGVIHNDRKEITHAFKHKAWITCVLQFKERKRTIMAPGRWTELFFLDEATAFAAGHRPCFECRREDAKRFKKCWIDGNPSYNFSMATSVTRIDEIVHHERIDHDRKKVFHQRPQTEIPEGTFVLIESSPCVFHKGNFHRWTPFGYDGISRVPETSLLTVITPASFVNTFRAGYEPKIHL